MSINQLLIADLWERHRGLTESLAGAYSEAAHICFNRHHRSPKNCDIVCDQEYTAATIEWSEPTASMISAWANEIDTTEAGAYGVCLAAVEERLNLVAIARAETLTGADYYVAPIGSDENDLEDKIRLEISGMNAGDHSSLAARLRKKQAQAMSGKSGLPALAAVVGFQIAKILISEVSQT